jgi:hypothetical protein
MIQKNELKPETESARNPKCDLEKILEWASQLTGESQPDPKREDGYIQTGEYACAYDKLTSSRGQLIAITSPQGIGKSTTLCRLFWEVNRHGLPTILTRAGDPVELIDELRFDPSLIMTYTEPILRTRGETAYSIYKRKLFDELKKRQKYLPRVAKLLPASHEDLDLDWGEKVLGKAALVRFRWEVWLTMLMPYRNILIDFPDCPTTDKRRVARHLDCVHRVWSAIKNSRSAANIVIALQRDQIESHHFLDKMETIELKPLTTTQLRASYINKFGSPYPFSNEGLTKIAQLSFGNGRQFKRWLTSVLELWRSRQEPQRQIDVEIVMQTLSADRLNRELNLDRRFPRQLKFASKAAQLILELVEHTPQPRSDVGNKLDLRPYELTRMLENLSPYVTQLQDGKRKLLQLANPGGS